ncbi:BsuPI-related putative proteinase inhibitor [Shouchella shacheensis]|uniref:BsuPI-related putative proteinase inhibitor n=1 Tax=Shouchella shacheensis TaxID=1649580 RepID=UPI00073FB66C|nr:BsuPI-related putative proteinase inhibitor [Shouchella shacheensis]
MRPFGYALAACAMLLASGCGGQEELEDEHIPVSGGGQAVEGWMFEVEQSQDGSDLNVDMTLTNETSEAGSITFPSAQHYELTLTSEEHGEVYRYSEQHMFAMQIVQLDLEAGETRSFSETIPTDNIESGTYELVVELTASQVNGQEIGEPEEFRQTLEVEI